MAIEISVCIPCIYAHIKYLSDCLDSISNQSLRPHEVVVVVSNIPIEQYSNTVSQLEALRRDYPKLSILIDTTPDAKYAGENRNKAVFLASGQVISFMDADDMMRRDRLQCIAKIFEMDRNIVGIIHRFNENVFPRQTQEVVSFDEQYIKEYVFRDDLHFGHTTFLKKIFDEYKYSDKPRGQDVEFVHNILEKYIACLRIYDQPLSYYISNRSTFYNN